MIEPSVNQLLGACILRASMEADRRFGALRLGVVRRSRARTTYIAALAERLGFELLEVIPSTVSPYLNKWNAVASLPREERSLLAVVDWDTFIVRAGPLAVSLLDSIVCRPNPGDMYSDALSRLARARVVEGYDGTELNSSVNSGVVLGTIACLKACASDALGLATPIRHMNPELPAWAVEQLAFSLSLRSRAWTPLPSEWNATPLTRIPDEEVCLFHYNDSARSTRALKELLLEPESVHRCLGELATTWPIVAARFERLHATQLDLEPFRSFRRLYGTHQSTSRSTITG